jgi:2-oxoisovalerate dehydrogenase E2 component (dihydrolipoyl transacylase)
LIVKEGETVPTGAPIAIIDEVGAATAPSEQVALGHTASPAVASPPAAAHANGARNGAATNAPELLRRVSPAVRRLAREHSIDLTAVRGSGTGGRITANDVLAAASQGPASVVGAAILEAPVAPPPPTQRAPQPARATYVAPIPGETIPFTQARRIIAQRMAESKRTIPHAWTMVEVDVTNVWKWRAREKDAFERDSGVKLTLLPFFMRAVVESLAQYPLMNAKFTEEGIAVSASVNLSIAVALDGNLILPVVRNADQLSIKGIALAAGALIDRARRGKLGPDDLAGGTFTVNNTGANGSILSAPIIPVGQTAIVTMEAAVRRPVVRDDDAIVIRSMMNVCLSLDHRVVDGSIASGFLVDLKRRLEAMGPTGPL